MQSPVHQCLEREIRSQVVFAFYHAQNAVSRVSLVDNSHRLKTPGIVSDAKTFVNGSWEKPGEAVYNLGMISMDRKGFFSR